MRCFKTPYLEGMTILAEVTLKKKIEGNRRLCKLCQKQEIGDEFHYILECPIFKCKRKLLIKQKYIQNPNMKQLKMFVDDFQNKKGTY